MASALSIGEIARENSCNGVVDRIDDGAAAGNLFIRTGAPPATPATADSGTLLATLPMSDPAFGNATTAGVATANAITDATAAASGAAGHFRVKDSNGVVIIQGTAGETADAPDMVFNDKDVILGGLVECTSMVVTMPAS